jgi:hypothetical protein
VKRGDTFSLSWLKDICIVTATRKGTLYFRSGDDRYQMPIDTYKTSVAASQEDELEQKIGEACSGGEAF